MAKRFLYWRWFLIVLVLVLFVFVISNTVARYADDGPHAAFAKLQARALGGLEAHWNESVGIPDFVTGKDPSTRIPYTPSAAERGNPTAIARGFLDENRALFKLTSADADFKPLRVEADPQLGYAHVRLSQMYKGIPVFGKQLVVHIDQQDQIVTVNGSYVPEIDVPTQPAFSAEIAERVAREHLLKDELDAAERATVQLDVLREQTRLMIYVASNGKVTLTWQVTIMTEAPLGQWLYFVHAGRPLVVHHFDSVAHEKIRRTYTADKSTSIPGRLLIEEGERARNDDIAQAAHDNAGKVYDYYMRTFKRDAVDGKGGELISTVHYGSTSQDADNAAWIGQRQQMIYGDGARVFKPLPLGLDVVGHEFTHGLTDNTAGLIYEAQSGALNESYSDVFAAMIDRDDWTIGEEVMRSAKYLRSLENPGAGGGGGKYNPSNPLQSDGQPAHMREYANLPVTRKTDNGGVHINSGIPNRAAFLIAKAIGHDKTEQIYYRTLTQYLTPDSDFAAMVRATLKATQELYPNDVNAVRDAFAQVGMSDTATPSQPPARTTPTPQPQRPQPTPAPSQPVAGCSNLIVNGGFESTNSGWIEVTAGQQAIIDNELPHSGSRSAWLGGTDEEALQYIYQDIKVPANVTSAKLIYWRFLHEEKNDDGADVATFAAVVAKPNGDPIGALEEVTSDKGDDTWRKQEFDLSEFAGKTIRLAFVAGMTPDNISSYFVDDVELQACTTGQQQQPQATGDKVFVQGTIKNADTGRGIEGAKLFILRQGLSADDAADDDSVTRDEIIASGISDASGFYRTDVAIPRGTYSVIVIASGYRPILANDGIKISADAKGSWVVNASMRPSR
jgi:Zn-dependent metalloprotease